MRTANLQQIGTNRQTFDVRPSSSAVSSIQDTRSQTKQHKQRQSLADNSDQARQLSSCQEQMRQHAAPALTVTQANSQNSPIQMVGAGTYLTNKDCHLRDDEREAILDLKMGQEVTIARGARTWRFAKYDVLGIGKKAHTWATVDGTSGWILDSAITLKASTSNSMPSKSDPFISSDSEDDRPNFFGSQYSGGQHLLIDEESSSEELKIEPKRSHPLDRLGHYFDPKIAPVKDENRMALGGNVGYDQIYQKDYSANKWVIKPIGGNLCNQIDKPITGRDAWVLDTDGILHGSQAFKEAKDYERFQYKDMDSHEKACVNSAIWAGEMEVADGKIVSINNQSGTFHFESEANINILTYLLKHEIISKEQIDTRSLSIEEWRQTGLDREGELLPWLGFKRAPKEKPFDQQDGETIDSLSISSSKKKDKRRDSSHDGIFDFEDDL